jgi:hypothetical protein
MAYSKHIIVDCIKRHYDLLVRAAYLNPNDIETPPLEGWSDEQLVVDILRTLGRSEQVIELLRHLPYIKSPRTLDRYEVYEETVAISYLRRHERFGKVTAESCRGKTVDDFCLMPADADWPPSFISLTEGREATWWVIDTNEGVKMQMHGQALNLQLIPIRRYISRWNLHSR